MRIGYPCINRTIGCKADSTFRLKSYSEDRLKQTVSSNLDCLEKILLYNVSKGILFFRITSDLVPFASHPVCKFDWQSHFKRRFSSIGAFIRAKKMRISMHPDQFTLINSVDKSIFERSAKELVYHAEVLDLFGLDTTAKVQIHIGGVYNDRAGSIRRFINRYGSLPELVLRRLVLENDEKYPLRDCLFINRETGVPILFDKFHHEIFNNSECIRDSIGLTSATWVPARDGIPMVDYSSQMAGERRGKHADSLDENDFLAFLHSTKDYDFDLMLELKDKEASALRAIRVASNDPRLAPPEFEG
ncbi:MAG: UV DNA damage repair endonuclease UvsE [Candidatus Methanosuratincola sp.]